MDKIPDAIYNRINNKVYETPGDVWWGTNINNDSQQSAGSSSARAKS